MRTAAAEEIAAREVIVSAGAIHSPAILFRSGIGIGDGLAVGSEPQGPRSNGRIRSGIEADGADGFPERACYDVRDAIHIGPC